MVCLLETSRNHFYPKQLQEKKKKKKKTLSRQKSFKSQMNYPANKFPF